MDELKIVAVSKDNGKVEVLSGPAYHVVKGTSIVQFMADSLVGLLQCLNKDIHRVYATANLVEAYDRELDGNYDDLPVALCALTQANELTIVRSLVGTEDVKWHTATDTEKLLRTMKFDGPEGEKVLAAAMTLTVTELKQFSRTADSRGNSTFSFTNDMKAQSDFNPPKVVRIISRFYDHSPTEATFEIQFYFKVSKREERVEPFFGFYSPTLDHDIELAQTEQLRKDMTDWKGEVRWGTAKLVRRTDEWSWKKN